MAKYNMGFIADKDLYAAVMFARKMIRQGKPAGLANYTAAKFYNVDMADVAHYVGQAAGRSKRRSR